MKKHAILPLLLVSLLTLVGSGCEQKKFQDKPDYQFSSLAYNGSQYAAGTPGGIVLTSDDAHNWQAVEVPGTLDIRTMTTFQGQLIGISYVIGVTPSLNISSANIVLKSNEGKTWQTWPIPMSGMVTGLASNDRRLITTSDSGDILTSTDSTHWSAVDLSSPTFGGVAWVNDNFIAWSDTTLFRSDDGLQWQQTPTPDGMYGIHAAAGDGTAITLAGDDGQLWRLDGNNQWQRLDSQTQGHFYAIAWGDGRFVAVGYDNNHALIRDSLDGVNWRKVTVAPNTPPLYSAIWDGTQFVIGGANKKVLQLP